MTSRTTMFAAGAVGAAIVVFVLLRSGGGDEKDKRNPITETTSSVVIPPPTMLPSPNPGDPDAGLAAVGPSGEPIDLSKSLIAAKKIDAAKVALAAGDPKKALAEIEEYQHFPEANPLKQEANVIKMAALAKTGRKTDALALAMSTRGDPAYDPYRDRIQAILSDAGL